MIKDMKLHHIGVATRSIVKELDYFAYLGYKPASEEFIDEEQGIRGVFMEAKDQPRLELLENLAHSTTLDGVLAKGNKFYHFAYESDDLTQDIAKMLRGGKLVASPIRAVYFDQVAFIMMRNMMMIELVKTRRSDV